jgi:hypothetical protein
MLDYINEFVDGFHDYELTREMVDYDEPYVAPHVFTNFDRMQELQDFRLYSEYMSKLSDRQTLHRLSIETFLASWDAFLDRLDEDSVNDTMLAFIDELHGCTAVDINWRERNGFYTDIYPEDLSEKEYRQWLIDNEDYDCPVVL